MGLPGTFGKILVAPSLLSADFADMARAVADAEDAGADMLHCDVMDGEFVPNITFGPKMVADIRKRTRLPLDVHLMIVRPGRYVGIFADAGADYITAHIEAAPGDAREILAQIGRAGAKRGLALNPDTPASAVVPYLGMCDIVTVMGVRPGFGGQKFIPSALNKLTELRSYAEKYRFKIEIDGGVTAENAAEIRNAGADVIVAGNAFFNAANRAAAAALIRGAKSGG